MPEPKGLKEAIIRWNLLTKQISDMTTIDISETEASKLSRIERVRKDYAFFVEYYFPHWCTDKATGNIIQCARFQIKAAREILREHDLRALFKWFRGAAKSTHMDVFIPMWLKCQKEREINVMVLVGKSEDNANTLLGDLQAELQYNKRYINDFGKQYNSGSWTTGKFVTSDNCAFFALGRGQSPRGLRYRDKRPDYIVIDDLDDDELVKNDKRVRETTDWVKEALFGCFGAQGGRFIMVGNIIAKNSVLANIEKTEGVIVSQVNVRDKSGLSAWPELWTEARIKSKELFMGYRHFQREYMNNPITEGAIFKNTWIRYKKMLPPKDYDTIVAYCDPSFKGSTKNDYKAIKVWGKKGIELHQLKAFCRQCSVAEMVRWWYDFHESIPENVICQNFMEANFLQDIILDEFTEEGRIRGYQLPISPDYRKKPDKFQRIEQISSLWERGFTFYNIDLQNDPDMLTGIEQTLGFEKGTNIHDDGPDADEGAIYILQKNTRLQIFEPKIGHISSPKNSW